MQRVWLVLLATLLAGTALAQDTNETNSTTNQTEPTPAPYIPPVNHTPVNYTNPYADPCRDAPNSPICDGKQSGANDVPPPYKPRWNPWPLLIGIGFIASLIIGRTRKARTQGPSSDRSRMARKKDGRVFWRRK